MKRFSLFASLAVLIFLPSSAFAQGRAQIDKPTFEELPSPELNAGKNKAFKPKNWLEIEAKMRIPAQSREQKDAGYIDQVTVKWYVALKSKDRAARILLVTKDITHINVPVDADIYSSVYLSPMSMVRLTGNDRGGKMAVESVGIEVLVNGVKVGEESTKGTAGWWNSPSDKISRNDKIPLLNKYETPFKIFWWDRYAEIEEKK
jgi:hypothetical protein